MYFGAVDLLQIRYAVILTQFCPYFRGLFWPIFFSLRDINLTLGLFPPPPRPPRKHVVWRDSGVSRALGQGWQSECADIFHQIFLWLLHHTDEPPEGRNSCLWLQSRSVLSSFDVVVMSCRSNFHVYDQHCSILLVEFNRSQIAVRFRPSRA